MKDLAGSYVNYLITENLMKKANNKNGFTLIEIIVVLTIIGILASISLPSLFSNVAKSRVAEGLAALSSYKSQTEGCVQSHYSSAGTNCAWSALSLASASGNFFYTFATTPTNSTFIYAIKATNSSYSSDTITLTRGGSYYNIYTCTGVGNYAGAC